MVPKHRLGGGEERMQQFFYRIKQKITGSINAKFLVMFLVLLIIPLIMLTQIFIVRLHSVLKAKEQASIDEKIQFAGSEFDRIFSDMDRITTSLILDYHVTDILNDPALVPSYEWFTGYKSMNSLLSLLTTNSGHTFQITVISADNRLYRSGALHNAMLTTDAPIFTHVSEGNGQPVIFNRALENFDETEVITFGRSVFQKGKFLGTILVELPVDYLNSLLSPFDSDSTQLYVLGENSKIIYASVPVESAVIPPELNDALYSGNSTVSFGRTSYLFRQMPMRQHPLSIVAMVKANTVFQESTHVISAYVLGFGLLTAATICGILLLTFFYTRNIRALNAAVSSFGEQTVTGISLPVRSQDEIGQLTQGVISMSHRINRLVSQIRENERNKRILEFNSLQAQINPHFLYNTMDMINWMAQQGRTSEVCNAVQSLSRFYKLTLSRKKGISTIAKEEEHVSIYVHLQNMRYHDSISFISDIPDELMEYQIPKLTLQPVIENSILHGILEKPSKSGTIVLTGWMEDGDIVLLISDDGVGIAPDKLPMILSGEGTSISGGTNIAIYNTHRRLQVLYGADYGLTYSSDVGKGTEVQIRIPAKRDETSGETPKPL